MHKLLTISIFYLALAVLSVAEVPTVLELPFGRKRFRLDTQAHLKNLSESLAEWENEARAFEITWKKRRAEIAARAPLENQPVPALRDYYHEPKDVIIKRERRGIVEIKRRVDGWLKLSLEPNEAERQELLELADALRNGRESVGPARVDLVEIPILAYDYKHNPVGVGRTAASNVDQTDSDGVVDPPASSFWEPRKIHHQNLWIGFERREQPAFDKIIWEYADPKTSYGGNPGCELTSPLGKIKVKFGEVHSEPFTARLFHALGYHVDPTDYASALKFKYSRRFFREFHLRKEIKSWFTIGGVVPVHRVNLQRRRDPLDFIQKAVLLDGSEMSAQEVRAYLLRDSKREDAYDIPENFNVSFEKKIDYLVTVPVNVQPEDGIGETVGPWRFQGLGREDLRELRGAGLVAAWVGWFDSRFDNTRLRLVNQKGTNHLRHFFTDLGGGLGRADAPLKWQGESANDFPWQFTEADKKQVNAFRIIQFLPIEDTEAFKQMTRADAMWAARKMAQFGEDQLLGALLASGFAAAEARLFTEKLLVRRDQLFLDMGLQDYPLSRPGFQVADLNFDPAVDHEWMERKEKSLGFAIARGTQKIRGGKLVP